jgi:hypothetical protein
MAILSVSQNYHPPHPKPSYMDPENLEKEILRTTSLKLFNFSFFVRTPFCFSAGGGASGQSFFIPSRTIVKIVNEL